MQCACAALSWECNDVKEGEKHDFFCFFLLFFLDVGDSTARTNKVTGRWEQDEPKEKAQDLAKNRRE